MLSVFNYEKKLLLSGQKVPQALVTLLLEPESRPLKTMMAKALQHGLYTLK